MELHCSCSGSVWCTAGDTADRRREVHVEGSQDGRVPAPGLAKCQGTGKSGQA